MSLDQDIEELRRQALANPDDQALQKRYDMALRRTGQSLPLLERYKFRYKCPLKWADLDPLPHGTQRFCRQCEKSVYMVRTPEEFKKHAREGHCIAAVEIVFEDYVAETTGEEQKGPHCVIELAKNTGPQRVQITMGSVPEPPKPWWSKLWPFS